MNYSENQDTIFSSIKRMAIGFSSNKQYGYKIIGPMKVDVGTNLR
jgi:hypothetical protein